MKTDAHHREDEPPPASDREILAYVQRARDDPALDERVQLDFGLGTPATLQAHLRPGRPGQRPAPLSCELAQVRRLVQLGYLGRHLQDPWVESTPAGEALLARG